MFWILVCLFVVIAIAILSYPMWRKPAAPRPEQAVDALNVLRDQRQELDEEVASGRLTEAEREARIAELARRVHDEGLATAPVAAAPAAPARRRLWLALALAIVVPSLALPVYFIVGTPAALDPIARAPANATSPHGDFTPAQVRAMLDKLKARLVDKPDDLTGWMMLGRGSLLIEDFAGSAAAFEKAVALKSDDPGLLADYADALAMARGSDLSGKPSELVQQALKIDPQFPKALALAASAEFAQGRFESAKGYWVRLLAIVPPDSEDASEVRTMIAQIDAKAGGKAGAAAAPGAGTAAPGAAATPPVNAATAAASAITGTVKLSPALAAKVKPDDVLYIFARPAEGSRMPLAILRLKAADLPREFRLDDTLSMPGSPTLSSAPKVQIEARVSRNGDARANVGDLRGTSAVTAPGAKGVAIVIDEEITTAPPGAAPGMPAGPAAATGRPAAPAPVPAPVAPQAAAPARPGAPAPAAAAPAASGKAITGTVRLSPSLAAKMAPDDTLFIFARAAEGSRMPLAILRLKASELPRQFKLDDSLGMAGGPPLSSTPQVKIEARISKSGEAVPRPGDLRGESPVVAPGAGNVEVLIDRAVP